MNGTSLQRKWKRGQRPRPAASQDDPQRGAELAADIASGRPFEPSLHHLADIFGVPVGALGKAVKARGAAQMAPVKETAVEVAPATEAEAVFNPPLGVELDPPSAVALVNAWDAADFAEREWFVRTVGVDAVWDVIAQLVR